MSVPNLSILVASCDAYADLWEPATKLLDYEWQDCIFPVFLGSNQLVFKHPSIKNITVGEDKSWCDSVYKMLLQIESDYVILLLEDFFLTEKTDTQNITRLLNWVKENNVDCCRLIKNRFSEGKILGTVGNIQLHEITPFTPYRISTQAAIWNKNYLMALLNPKYSAWYFEGANSKLVNYTKSKIVSVSRPVIFYKHAVERGKWIKQGIDNLERHEIKMDYQKRGVFQLPPGATNEPVKAAKFPPWLLDAMIFIKYFPDLVTLKMKLFKIRWNGK